ncbi:MAG TPA: large conductance mechanosensitive channel protein MscL [Acidimicrobiales bacterium]|nr:large conductance mechanosensitive channel protein MscL [Acidimicrobiales bacterium]
MKKLYEEFKEFVLRGNILDLAVAVILGTAFAAVVKTFTDGVLMPIIAAIFGKPSFDDLTFTIGDGVVRYGTFFSAIVNFLIIAAALFIVLKAATKLMREKEEESGPTEVELLTEIRDALRAERP